MARNEQCPEAALFAAMIGGSLAEERQELLAEHLETCEDCQQVFETLANEGHGLPCSTRILSQYADLARDPALQELIEKIQRNGPDRVKRSDELSQLEDLKAHLQPSDEPGHLGRLGSYEVLELVGRGGMGVVLKAVDGRLNRCVAIKLLTPLLAADPVARRRFLREAQACAAINHPNVVTIHAVDETGGLPLLVMEYVEGISLEQRLQREGPLELKDILRIGIQAAYGLAAAHAQGLIHRDIKPANILLENSIQRVKITDFGLTRAADDLGLTQTGVIAGTPQYMSPEQARGEAVDPRSDLFSLGCVLYAMCTGRSPFHATSVVDCLHRVCFDIPRPIRQENPDTPAWLAEIIDRLLQKDPSLRFSTAAELAELLERHLAQLQQPSSASAGDPPPQPTKPKSRKRVYRLWAIAAAVAIGVAGLAMTDTFGVTNMGQWLSTVLRIQTPHGVLVVRIEDPKLKVAVDGEGDVITLSGIGEHTIELRPGTYRVVKDGPVAGTEWVTVTRGGKEVVTVGREPLGAAPDAGTGAPPADREVDLLKLIDPTRDSLDPNWSLDSGLSTVVNAFSFLAIPYLVPEEFDLAFVIRRNGGDAAFGIGMTLDDRPCGITLDWKSGETVRSGFGVEKWNEYGLVGNGVRGRLLPVGQDASVLCRVRHKGSQHQIGLYVNDQLVYDWEGRVSELTSDPPRQHPHDSRRIDLVNLGSAFHIKRLVLHPVSNMGRPVFSGLKAPVDRQIAEHVLWRLGRVSLSVDGKTVVQPQRVDQLPPAFRLVGLDLRDLSLPADLALLAKASNLETLVLRGKGQCHEALMSSLLTHQTLKEVDLANGIINQEAMERIARLPNLERLNLSFTEVTDAAVAVLARCKTLRQLSLARTPVTDVGMESVAELNHLEQLDLSATKVSHLGLKRIGCLKELRKLAIDFLPVDDDGARPLLGCSQLTALSLACTNVSDAFLEDASKLKKLKSLCVVGTKVSQKGVSAFQQVLPECQLEHDLQTPVDLLGLVKSERDGVVPGWSFQDGALVSPNKRWDTIRIPYTPPNDYVLKLTARRDSGTEAFCVGLVVGGNPCFLTMGTYHYGPRSGLEWICGHRINENETAYLGEPITAGKPFSVYAIVRGSSVRATLDGQLVVDWDGNAEQLSVPLVLLKSTNKTMCLGAYRTVYSVAEMKLVPLPASDGRETASNLGMSVDAPLGD